MSIINQALQKAQHEQLAQRPYAMPYLSTGQHRRTRRRRWLMWSLTCGMVLGLGGLGTRWLFFPPSVHLAVSPKPPAASPKTFVEVALRGTPRQAPVALGAETHLEALSGQQPEAAAVAQTAAPSPVVVLAVESTSTPLPVPHAVPQPPPASAVPPPEPEGAAPIAADRSVPSRRQVARGQQLLQQALEAQDSGDLTRAIILLEQALTLDPTSKAAYNSLGNVYFQQKRFQQAVSVYQQALALDPDYAKARNNLGSAYLQMAMYEQAITELQQALRNTEGASLAYYNLACVYARKGDSATAAQYLRQAIILEPQARTWARTDADFAPVRSALAVQQLLEP